MNKRLKNYGKYHSNVNVMADFNRSYKSPSNRSTPAGKVIKIKTYLPLSVALRARNKIYTYKFPSQIRKKGRVIRLPLTLPKRLKLKAHRKAKLIMEEVRRKMRRRHKPLRLKEQLMLRRKLKKALLIVNPMVQTHVRIRLPRFLPMVYGSYVSLTDDTLNIHSENQLRRLQDAQEFNRRRYVEHKGNHRQGRNGQLDSPGSRRFGSVAEAVRRGRSIAEIADAGMAARAISR